MIIPLIALGNEQPLAADSTDLRPGVIAMANEARLATATYSEPLTQYLVGWLTRGEIAELQAELDYIAPPVPVPRRFSFKKSLNSEAFLSELDDERPIGAGFKRVEYKGESAEAKTGNKGLTLRLDRDEEGPVLNEERAAALLTARLLRNELRRGYTALSAIDAAGENKAWAAGATPDEDMGDAVDAAQLSSGIYPNRAVLGLAAWRKRRKAYAVGDKAGDIAGYGATVEDVAKGLGLENMRLSRSLYQFSGTEKKRILQSSFIPFYTEPGLGKDDPSHMKRFYTPAGTGLYRVLRQEIGSKFVDITVEHYSLVAATALVGVKKLNIT